MTFRSANHANMSYHTSAVSLSLPITTEWFRHLSPSVCKLKQCFSATNMYVTARMFCGVSRTCCPCITCLWKIDTSSIVAEKLKHGGHDKWWLPKVFSSHLRQSSSARKHCLHLGVSNWWRPSATPYRWLFFLPQRKTTRFSFCIKCRVFNFTCRCNLVPSGGLMSL